jgi:ATP-binding cassette, subfamily B, bacterial MsbA
MRQEMHVVRRLISILGWYPWAISSIIALGLFSSLTQGFGIGLFIPLINSFDKTAGNSATGRWIVDLLSGIFHDIPPTNRFLVITSLIILSAVIRTIASYLNAILTAWQNSQVGHRLRSGIFEQLLTISYSYLERRQTGTLLNTLASETWRTCQALSVLIGAITACCMFITYIAFLFLISWQLTIVVGVAMIFISLVIRCLSRHVKDLGDRATQANSRLADRMLEGFWGMKLIRAFGREQYEKDRFDRASEEVNRTFLKLGVIGGVVSPIYEIMSIGLLVGVLLYFQPQITGNLAPILVFIYLLYRLQPILEALDGSRLQLLSLSAGVEAVTSFMDRSDKPYPLSGKAIFHGLDKGIELSSVTFRYEIDAPPALTDVSMVIPARKTTALVGPSGAGKSTLINLLFRFYETDQGYIFVDGRPLRELDIASWRQRLALVSQDAYMLNATVRENIAYGKLDATTDEIIDAARKAQAHEFIMKLPEAYESQVGNRGVFLSGGQQQRITLARAIIRDPVILILDEATNQLDSIAEHLVQEALESFSGQKTIIIIAHRLSTVGRADHIAVLNNGELCEQGKLQNLLELNGLFAKLYRLQYRNVLR